MHTENNNFKNSDIVSRVQKVKIIAKQKCAWLQDEKQLIHLKYGDTPSPQDKV